jgi:hypothetical protein
MRPERWPGIVAGFGLAGVPGLTAIMYLRYLNTYFVDAPFSLWFWLIVLPGLIGALLGTRWRLLPERWPLLLVVGELTIITGFSIPSGEKLEGLELLVVGVDGASWSVIDPMIQGGELDAFQSLKVRGAAGIMKAPEPIFSPLIWTTLASGVRPADHGIHGFSMEADEIRVPRFWNIAADQGRSIGVYKWLVTWPPERLDAGFMVPAWLAKSSHTSPERFSVAKELELSRRTTRPGLESGRGEVGLTLDLVRIGMRWSTLRTAIGWRLWMAFRQIDSRELDAGLQLLRVAIDRDVFIAGLWAERPAVASFTGYATDALSHRFWRFHEPDRFPGSDELEQGRYGEIVRDTYRQADLLLGELISIIPPETRLVVLSDHGFQALVVTEGVRMIPRTEALASWLSERECQAEVLRQGGKLRVLSSDARLVQLLQAFVAEQVVVKGQPLFRVETIPGEAQALGLAVIAERLEPTSILATGEPLTSLMRPAAGLSGDHHPEGIFMAVGPGVTEGGVVDISALDLTPILLAALGIPKGDDMPGRVPDGLWPGAGTTPTWSHLREGIDYVEAGEEVGDALNQELRALGYVD